MRRRPIPQRSFLLVFEDIARRRDPVLVIRFAGSSGRAADP